MDYFQGVVTDYLRANRATFVNTEFLLQLDDHPTAPKKDRHWYVDALTVNFKEKVLYLCEVSYAKSLWALINRLTEWEQHWNEIGGALVRDASVPETWDYKPWVFIPEGSASLFSAKTSGLSIAPKVTHLESVLPWKYRDWNRMD